MSLPSGELVVFGSDVIRYEDVLLAGCVTAATEQLCRFSVVGSRVRAEESPSADDMHRAIEMFRRERHLESSELLHQWLDERGLSAHELTEHFARACAVSEVRGDALGPFDPADIDLPALRCDAFARGFFDQGAREIIDWFAASSIVGIDDVMSDLRPAVDVPEHVVGMINLDHGDATRRAKELAARREALTRLSATLATESALGAVVEKNWLDWSKVDIELLELASESAAKEAMACVRDDHMAPDVIAKRADVELVDRAVRSGELEHSIAAVMLSSRLGDAVGPVVLDDRWSVLWVKDRTPPDVADPLIRLEATNLLVREALDNEIRGRVTWKAPT